MKLHLHLSPWTQLPNNNNRGIWEDVPVWELFCDTHYKIDILYRTHHLTSRLSLNGVLSGCCCVGGWLFVRKSFEQSMKLKNILFVFIFSHEIWDNSCFLPVHWKNGKTPKKTISKPLRCCTMFYEKLVTKRSNKLTSPILRDYLQVILGSRSCRTGEWSCDTWLILW